MWECHTLYLQVGGGALPLFHIKEHTVNTHSTLPTPSRPSPLTPMACLHIRALPSSQP